MNHIPDVRKMIIEDHPLLFKHGPSFECMQGWFGIIERLADKLEPLIEKYREQNPVEDIYPCASQVKEKHGTLRFYMYTETDEISKLIEESEEESARTCEICGLPGKLDGGPSYSTLCEEHI